MKISAPARIGARSHLCMVGSLAGCYGKRTFAVVDLRRREGHKDGGARTSFTLDPKAPAVLLHYMLHAVESSSGVITPVLSPQQFRQPGKARGLGGVRNRDDAILALSASENGYGTQAWGLPGGMQEQVGKQALHLRGIRADVSGPFINIDDETLPPVRSGRVDGDRCGFDCIFQIQHPEREVLPGAGVKLISQLMEEGGQRGHGALKLGQIPTTRGPKILRLQIACAAAQRAEEIAEVMGNSRGGRRHESPPERSQRARWTSSDSIVRAGRIV